MCRKEKRNRREESRKRSSGKGALQLRCWREYNLVLMVQRTGNLTPRSEDNTGTG